MNKYQVVILAGGFGTRISEETHTIPKPMIDLDGRPILWHIMKYYSSFGFNDFIICCGYKSYVIKEYFSNYYMHNSDLRISLGDNSIEWLNSGSEDWTVTLVDTGLNSMTGGRLKLISHYLQDGPFLMTYGDGLSDVNLDLLIESHLMSKKLATVTAVSPPGRFGALSLDPVSGIVNEFQEKPIGDGSRINAGYFVLDKKVIELIDDTLTVWEKEPLERLANAGELNAYLHDGFWQPMDTLRDKKALMELLESGSGPWCVWDRINA